MIDRLGPPLDKPIFEVLAIVGVGLIGSSVARAARWRRAADRIVIADQSKDVLARARALALGDEFDERFDERSPERRLCDSLRAGGSQ